MSGRIFEPTSPTVHRDSKTETRIVSGIEKVDYPYGIYNTHTDTPFLLFGSFNEIVVSITRHDYSAHIWAR